MELTQEQLKKLKRVELLILAETARVCNKYQIKYFLHYGTLIGAVRHQGFIPWDDDIDIAMLRKDYEYFLAVASKEISPDFLVIDYESDNQYGQSKCKVMAKNTVMEEYNAVYTKSEKGIFIDVFPLDFAPEGKIPQFIHKNVNYFSKKMLLLKSGNVYAAHGIKKYGYDLAILCSRAIPRSWLIKMHKNNATQYGNGSKMVVSLCSPYLYEKELSPVAWFENVVDVQFEGYSFSAPAGYDSVLKAIYGDYMKLPPEEQRKNKHELKSLDFGEYDNILEC